MRERLALRLATTDPIIVAYDDVRETLAELAAHPNQEPQVANFEAARDRFMGSARTKMLTAIHEVSP